MALSRNDRIVEEVMCIRSYIVRCGDPTLESCAVERISIVEVYVASRKGEAGRCGAGLCPGCPEDVDYPSLLSNRQYCQLQVLPGRALGICQ